ncbi:PepSY-associated TM helix domain-containing protein [Larkinella knui]|uniref:PepSY domain-containing protein n=1 Tax=Larkinella knui TaxID=2025310 RepID=A0A3P1CHA9_9BACT|nr:PepSY-associated TM helix domain-containing protein [Larkinella knui]RRB12722.1 PepSY domain-containing protein [Larkinella knui]
MTKNKQKSTWQKVRTTFHDLHLWLGIASGLILFIVCLSGTIYTFSSEIQEVADADKYTVTAPPAAQRQPAEVLVASVLKTVPGGTVQWISIPNDRARSYQISVKKGDDKEAKPVTYFVNPYTSEVLGTPESATSRFFMVVFRLHRWLLLDTEVGRPIVGVATLIFVLIILSGWVIWFPKKIKNWRQGLKVNFKGNWKRINHDLHNSLGLYASFLLMLMALTGLTWSFQWYKTGVNKMLGVYKPEGTPKEEPPKSTLPTDGSATQRLAIADYLKTANGILPYPGDYKITLPSDSVATVAISKNQLGFFAPAASDKLQLDQYTGKPLKTEIFAQKPLNERLASSFKSLHIGSFYGTFSKILYFITCLIATTLPVTGTLIWINKLRKKPSAKTKVITAKPQVA